MCDEEEESSKQDHKATHSNGSIPENKNTNASENENVNANVNAVFKPKVVSVCDEATLLIVKEISKKPIARAPVSHV